MVTRDKLLSFPASPCRLAGAEENVADGNRSVHRHLHENSQDRGAGAEQVLSMLNA